MMEALQLATLQCGIALQWWKRYSLWWGDATLRYNDGSAITRNVALYDGDVVAHDTEWLCCNDGCIAARDAMTRRCGAMLKRWVRCSLRRCDVTTLHYNDGRIVTCDAKEINFYFYFEWFLASSRVFKAPLVYEREIDGEREIMYSFVPRYVTPLWFRSSQLLLVNRGVTTQAPSDNNNNNTTRNINNNISNERNSKPKEICCFQH